MPRHIKLIRAAARDGLHERIAENIRDMNASGGGIFNEDISAIVAPYFPPGSTFDETETRARRERLRPLKMFAGHQDAEGGTIYVTSFDMMRDMFSNVFVAVYFTFENNGSGQRILKKTSAFLRASDM